MTGNRTSELLHKLLDERGVKWRTESYPKTLLPSEQLSDTYWQAGNAEWRFTERPDGRTYLSLIGIWLDCTPEQAIAATLGSGTCENLSEMNVDGVAGYHFICSECGLSVCASMGIGETEPSGPRSFRWKVDGRYEFEKCPRCGRKVKR